MDHCDVILALARRIDSICGFDPVSITRRRLLRFYERCSPGCPGRSDEADDTGPEAGGERDPELDGFTTLSAALTEAEAAGKILLVTNNLKLTANTTTGVFIIVLPGIGTITQTGAYTLNLAGGFAADPAPVFVGFASGQVTGLKEVLPEWWGGKADNSTDSTNSFILAFASINSSSESSTGLGNFITAPKFITQKGKYKITGTVTFPSALIWEGSDTHIIISAGVKAFVTPRGVYVLRINGVQFWGGATAIEYDPTSLDMRMVEIENCVFQVQTAYAIKTTNTAVVNGFNLRVRKSKFLNTSGNTSYVAIQNLSDLGLIEDCWFCNYATYEIENYGNLTIRGITNVPMTPGMTLVKNYGPYLNVTENRLGNESGGVVVVEQRASGVWDYNSIQYTLLIEKNFVYQSNAPLIRFYALPNQVIIRGNGGTNYQSSLYFDAKIPGNDVKKFSSSNYHNYENVTPLVMLTGDSTKYGAFLAGAPAKTLSVDSLISTWLTSGASVGSKACSSSGYTDLLGRSGTEIHFNRFWFSRVLAVGDRSGLVHQRLTVHGFSGRGCNQFTSSRCDDSSFRADYQGKRRHGLPPAQFPNPI